MGKVHVADGTCVTRKRQGACPVPQSVRWPLLVIIFCAVVYLLGCVTPYDPFETDYAQALAAPSLQHFLGCDYLGRDMLSRILLGARYSVLLSCCCVGATMCIGTLIGVCAGMKGGMVDSFLMRISDVFLAFPEVVLGIALVGFLGPGLMNVTIVILLVMWVRFARIARALVVQLKASDLIFTARLSGCSSVQIFIHYLMRPVLRHMRSIMMLEVGHIMLFLAAFSFLGLGIQPPTPEWGALLNEGRAYFLTAPHLMIAPGCALFMLVAFCNIIGAQMKRSSHKKKRLSTPCLEAFAQKEGELHDLPQCQTQDQPQTQQHDQPDEQPQTQQHEQPHGQQHDQSQTQPHEQQQKYLAPNERNFDDHS